jgi:hypothetical protein
MGSRNLLKVVDECVVDRRITKRADYWAQLAPQASG